MRVELGNPAPIGTAGPAVTYVSFPDGYGVGEGDIAGHLDEVQADQSNPSDVTHLPGQEALVAVVHPNGIWVNQSGAAQPSWVWSDNPDLERQLAEHYGCLTGRPADLEDTHHTYAGPPGIHPSEGEVI